MSCHLTVATLAAIVPLATLARPARAANQLVLGKVFIVANPDPTDASRRRVKVIGREPSGPSTIVGDPSSGGASLLVAAHGATDSSDTFSLPAAGWSAIATGFVYRDMTGAYGPVRVASIRDNGRMFQVKAVVLGSLGPGPQPHIMTVPPAPGTDGGATLTINGGDNYCVQFGGATGGQVTNSPTGSGTRLFKVRNATAEAGCVTTSTTSTSTSTSSSTSSSMAPACGFNVCNGSCPIDHFCYNGGGGNCFCVYIFGSTTSFPPTTATSTSTSTSSTTSSTISSPSAAFLDRD